MQAKVPKTAQNMNNYVELPNCVFSTEHQAIADAVNEFLASLPDNEEADAALRLAMELLEAADVAPQDELAQAAGFTQSRSLRMYKLSIYELTTFHSCTCTG